MRRFTIDLDSYRIFDGETGKQVGVITKAEQSERPYVYRSMGGPVVSMRPVTYELRVEWEGMDE